MPPVPGVDSPNVFRLWTVPDMDRIHAFIEEKKPGTAVIAGGGFIGLEMAEAFARRGIATTVVELLPQVMSTMDPEIGGMIAARLASPRGEGDHGRRAEGSPFRMRRSGAHRRQRDSRPPSCSCPSGCRPELTLARDAGLAIGAAGGLVVDEHLRTSDPHIWAAGDMNEVVHKVPGQSLRIPLAGRPTGRAGSPHPTPWAWRCPTRAPWDRAS